MTTQQPGGAGTTAGPGPTIPPHPQTNPPENTVNQRTEPEPAALRDGADLVTPALEAAMCGTGPCVICPSST